VKISLELINLSGRPPDKRSQGCSYVMIGAHTVIKDPQHSGLDRPCKNATHQGFSTWLSTRTLLVGKHSCVLPVPRSFSDSRQLIQEGIITKSSWKTPQFDYTLILSTILTDRKMHGTDRKMTTNLTNSYN
jgi:hypothetical protein